MPSTRSDPDNNENTSTGSNSYLKPSRQFWRRPTRARRRWARSRRRFARFSSKSTHFAGWTTRMTPAMLCRPRLRQRRHSAIWAREATVAAIAQLDAKTKKEVEQDEPAVTYDRVRNAVIALLVIDCVLVAIAALHGRSPWEGEPAYQVHRLFCPLVYTGMFLLFFGTLDSSAMAATAARTWRAYFIVLGALWAVVYALEGDYARAAFYLIFCWFGLAYYGTWLLTTVRERMRTRFKGKLAERAQLYTARLLQIASLQMALLVQGLAQGIGPHSTGRNEAIFTFSQALIGAWLFSTAVFDAGEADPQRASRACGCRFARARRWRRRCCTCSRAWRATSWPSRAMPKKPGGSATAASSRPCSSAASSAARTRSRCELIHPAARRRRPGVARALPGWR